MAIAISELAIAIDTLFVFLLDKQIRLVLISCMVHLNGNRSIVNESIVVIEIYCQLFSWLNCFQHIQQLQGTCM